MADKSFGTILDLAGIAEFRFHDLRHTFASRYMMNGGDLFELAKILGHSNIKMTERCRTAAVAEAKEAFASRFGFSIVPGSRFPDQRVENASISLPPVYFDLMWIYDREKASTGAAEMLRRLQDQRGFIDGYLMDVSPIEDAAAFLRALGKKVTLPPPPMILRNGKQQPGIWQDLFIEDESAPPVGLPVVPELPSWNTGITKAMRRRSGCGKCGRGSKRTARTTGASRLNFMRT
jgi:hypothetical protein